jgi:AraC-like DNA-binding protein
VRALAGLTAGERVKPPLPGALRMDNEPFYRITNFGYISHVTGIPGHAHKNEYEFHYLPKANCQWINGGRSLQLPDNSLVYSEPRVPHTIPIKQPPHFIEWYFFRFTVSNSSLRLFAGLRNAFKAKGYLRLGPHYDALFREMLLRLKTTDEFLHESGNHLFASFLYEIASNGRHASMIKGSIYVDSLVRQMQQAVPQGLDLSAIAGKMGIDKSYLIRLFKKRTGASPIKFFNKLKTDAAAHMLAETAAPINEIARQLGFCDEFYFSRLFKQYIGLSPTAYRQEHARRYD